MAKTIYICYFGVRQPLVQTQVIPYLLELRKDAVEIALLTFEPDLRTKWTPEQISDMKSEMAEKGIEWHCLAYHKRLSVLATVYDILAGALFVRRLINEGHIDILHGRVHVPTLMGAIARKLSKHKPKLLFDIRGFFPEEYTDAGIWPANGIIYRTVKRIEKWLMKEADGFVVLTEKARDILFPESKTTGLDKSGRPVEVIPCCVDFEKRFSGDAKLMRDLYRRRLKAENRFIIVHLGALGGLYLTKEIADLLAAARERNPTTFALFLTQSDPALIEPLLVERGFDSDSYFIGPVPPDDVEGFVYASDIGLSIVKAVFATKSRSPTKIPEYLAGGLPIIANAGVGDVDELILRNGVGALFTIFNRTGYSASLGALKKLGDIGEHCRSVARREFDLESVGGARYRHLYKLLLEEGENIHH